jgi:hypothetical protein
MRHFHASAVERRNYFEDQFATHPMEAGWASEATFFIMVEEVEGQAAALAAQVEISADGINWIPEGTTFPLINQQGHYFVRVRHFGNWLRVNGQVQGENSRLKLSVHLHLKE